MPRELLPEATKVIVLVNPRYPEAETQLADVRRAANEFGLNIAVLNITDETEFDRGDLGIKPRLFSSPMIHSFRASGADWPH